MVLDTGKWRVANLHERVKGGTLLLIKVLFSEVTHAWQKEQMEYFALE